MPFIKVQNFIIGFIRPKKSLYIHLMRQKKEREINGHYVFFSHKTHHFIHGVIKMNTFDDFVLDQNNTLLCWQFKPNLIVNVSIISTHKVTVHYARIYYTR